MHWVKQVIIKKSGNLEHFPNVKLCNYSDDHRVARGGPKTIRDCHQVYVCSYRETIHVDTNDAPADPRACLNHCPILRDTVRGAARGRIRHSPVDSVSYGTIFINHVRRMCQPRWRVNGDEDYIA